MWSKILAAFAWVKKHVAWLIGGAFTLLLALLGVKNGQLAKERKKVSDQKEVIQHLSEQGETQKKVVQGAEDAKGEFAKRVEQAAEELGVAIKEVKDIPQAEQKPLSEPVKQAAKAQAARIKARRKQ